MTASKSSSPRRSQATAPAGIHSLLVPVALTPSTDRPLNRVPLLPFAPRAQVTLLHVVPAGLSGRDEQSARRDAQRALGAEVSSLKRALPKDVGVDAVVKVGAADEEIGALVGRAKAELVVMGRCGRNRLREAFLGSTAERVVRRTRVPVLVVRLPARAPYAQPAVALELDSGLDEVIRRMLTLLPPPRPRISVIHAFDIPYQGLVYPSLSSALLDERVDEVQRSIAVRLTRRLAAALAKASVPAQEAPVWKTQVVYGSPRRVVERITTRSSADLLVVGTRAHTGAKYAFLGTVAGDLLREARCDVLVVPPQRA